MGGVLGAVGIFQSTSLSRGKTASPFAMLSKNGFFQSTSLSRGKTERICWFSVNTGLSIHFPLTREDRTGRWLNAYTEAFQSTSLSRGKTFCGACRSVYNAFNPLPSHEGRPISASSSGNVSSFNPLPSHEGRLSVYAGFPSTLVFQSTSLSRGKTGQDGG